MPRVKPETVTATSMDFVGKPLESGQDIAVAESLSILLDAIDNRSKELPLESEPADFTSVLEELSEEISK
jgi:hypothetical protein